MPKNIITLSVFFIFLNIYPKTLFSQNPIYYQKQYQSYSTFLTYLKDTLSTFEKDIERLSFVRNEIAKLINIGTGRKELIDYWEFNGEDFFTIFKNGDSTVFCGGTAHFAMQVYIDVGYESGAYDMGCKEGYTHEVTLVKNKDDNQFYVQDAYQNSAYYDRKNNQIPFIQIISLLRQRKHNQIKILQDKNQFYYDTAGLYTVLVQREQVKFYKLAYRYMTSRSKKNFIASGVRNNKFKQRCFTSNNFPKKNIYIFLMPINFHPAELEELFKD